MSQKQMTLGIAQTRHVSCTVGVLGNIRARECEINGYIHFDILL